MPITALIAPRLPLLRRYARALSGSQASGDSHVAAMLEALIAAPDTFDRALEPRVATYKLFSSIWNANPMNLAEAAEGQAAPDHRLKALTPLPRQVFLLTAVEGFSPREAAEILGVEETAIADLLAAAGEQIKAQVAAEVLIIEDEPIIAMDLAAIVEDLGHTVVGNARTHAEAVAMAERLRPGLVLADIRLADGSSGLDAVNDILARVEVPVIFITAYPEMLLTGERPEPTFLIAKPFRENTVKATVAQALFFETAATLGLRRTA